MAGGPDEQQELTGESADSKKQTRQEQIMNLYNANTLTHVAVGFWLKFIIEAIIVAVPIGVFLIPPGFILSYMDIGPITYLNTILAWISFTGTVLLSVWCFTESVIEEDEEEEDESGADDD